MKEIEINGIKETIVERSDYPIEQCKENLADEVTAILGYGPQGRGQGLNMRDQGFKVILGLRKGRSWDKALEDGWVEGKPRSAGRGNAHERSNTFFTPGLLKAVSYTHLTLPTTPYV